MSQMTIEDVAPVTPAVVPLTEQTPTQQPAQVASVLEMLSAGNPSDRREYHLPLRGNALNPMIDAATPLLGMVMRLSAMSSHELPEKLYPQVVTDISAIEQLLQNEGYEPGAVVSFRYVLCTFIDEIAMAHGWGAKNDGWLQQSLLVHFHNETWGGEKVYVLLERLMTETKRYQQLLEFIYLCFCLGFRGRYKVTTQSSDEFNRILRRLHSQLGALRGEAPPTWLYLDKGGHQQRYRLARRVTIRQILLGGMGVLVLVYLFYLLRLHSQSQDILEQLNQLLSQGGLG